MCITYMESKGLLSPEEREILIAWGKPMIKYQKQRKGNSAADSRAASGAAMISWGSLTNDKRLIRAVRKNWEQALPFVIGSIGKLKRHPDHKNVLLSELSLEDAYNEALAAVVEGAAMQENLGIDAFNAKYKGRTVHDAVGWWTTGYVLPALNQATTLFLFDAFERSKLMNRLPMITLLLSLSFVFPAFADAPRGFKEAKFQGSSPKVSGSEVTFTLLPGQCSSKKYGDGRGESDCKNGNIRSRINASKHAKLGQTMEYSLDFWIQPEFRYNKGNVPRSKLTIMEWQRINTIKNHIYVLHLDSSGGVKFEDKTCFGPARFGQWVTFKMRVKWSKNDDGFMEVLCDGKRIFALKGQNAIPPACGTKAKQQCHLDKIDLRRPIQWQVGPKLNGFGTVYKQFGKKSPFRPWPKAGLTMKVRNLYYGRFKK